MPYFARPSHLPEEPLVLAARAEDVAQPLATAIVYLLSSDI